MPVLINNKDGNMIAELEGDIDHHTAKAMREAIDENILRTEPKSTKLDFSKVKFMDSSGIGLIMGRYKLMKSFGGNLEVINVPKRLERMVKLAGLSALGLFGKE